MVRVVREGSAVPVGIALLAFLVLDVAAFAGCDRDAPRAPDRAEAREPIEHVTLRRVNIRASPNAMSRLVVKLDADFRLRVLEERPGWSRVAAAGPDRTVDGTPVAGWVRAYYIAPAPHPEAN